MKRHVDNAMYMPAYVDVIEGYVVCAVARGGVLWHVVVCHGI